MKIKTVRILLFLIISFGIKDISAQKIWNKIDKSSSFLQKKELFSKKNFPATYQLASLDIERFKKKRLSKSSEQELFIELPNSKGGFSKFILRETSNFEPVLAAKYPQITSYSAQGVDDPTAVAKISVGTDGFHAVVFSGTEETFYIDPYSKDKKEYIIYDRSSLPKADEDFKCQVEESKKKQFKNQNLAKNANDGQLRTFRLAIACSGEYAQFHLTREGVDASETDAVKKATVLSAMNTSLTRINGVYERDLSVRMVLVANNEDVIFLDAATDGISDGDPDAMLDEVQTICDTEIGDANYDIGHLFSIGGDGLAGGGVVCVSGQKAKGVTGRDEPVGDPYDIDYVAHEMGHQFGANHTQNNDCNRNNATAVEPGSSSTIMGYAGICSPNIQSQSDDYFHAVSITEMWSTIQSSATCGALSTTNNTAPTANAGLDYSIPKSTPFVVRGDATDVDGMSTLTYNWEQIDNEIASMPPVSTSTGGPMFRSLPSKTSPNRYLPDLATVVGNTSSTWEVLPSVARNLNFSFLVRDNNAGGGSSARDDMKVTVTDAAAFTVTSQNSAVSWDVWSTQTITWNKSTTDVAPINCANVNIKLSIDGGVTFPITIKSNTPNDGTEDIVVPNHITSTARIMVEAADNIFYNVNTTNFSIIPAYCPSTFTDEASGTEHITNVTFNTINNDSGNDTVDGYENFTSIRTNVERGESHEISVTFNTGGQQDHCYVFIDWNKDYVFDTTTERYDLGTKTEDVATATFTIEVPSDAEFGSTLMRVLIEYDDPINGYGEGACDSDHLDERGETEDYSIEVIDLQNVSLQTTSETCEDQNDGMITVNIKQPSYSYTITITGENTNLNRPISGSSFSFPNLSPGIYQVCVTNGDLGITQCFEVSITASNPISLTVSSQSKTGEYSFKVNSGTAPFEVFLDDDLLGVFNTTDFSLNIKRKGKILVKTAKQCEGEYKTSLDAVFLKHNPVSEHIELILPFNIEESHIDTVIFDMNGKQILRKLIKREDTRLSIPFKNYEKGIYILKLSIANSKPIKIIKE